jgi:spore coat protein U-like protein
MIPPSASAITRWLGRSLCAAAMAATQPTLAASCTIDSPGLVFGNYDPFIAMPLDSVGSLTVTCDEAVEYSIALSAGAGSFQARTLVGPKASLQYNLYTDATRTVIWGDGSGGSALVQSQSVGMVDRVHDVYGRIPARQNVPVGSYNDAITVLVSF